MKTLQAYNIPFVGLKNGEHKFEYEIDATFFEHFEASPIGKSDVFVQVTLDKHTTFFSLDFFIDGNARFNCDRCLDEIDVQVNGHHKLYVKQESERDNEEEDGADIVYIARGEHEINISPFLYDYINLSVPMVVTCDHEIFQQKTCNPTMLDRMDGSAEDSDEPTVDPRWEALAKLKKEK